MATYRARELLDPKGMAREHQEAIDAEAEAMRDAIWQERRKALLAPAFKREKKPKHRHTRRATWRKRVTEVKP